MIPLGVGLTHTLCSFVCGFSLCLPPQPGTVQSIRAHCQKPCRRSSDEHASRARFMTLLPASHP